MNPADAATQDARHAGESAQHARRRRQLFVVLLLCAFLFRLSFGLCSQFWADDERQVYLIGLKFYSTGAWPYFGPDVSSGVQVPGALQGLLTGLPLFAAHVPEAPFVLLNLLSFASLCLFAWYCTRRLPGSPAWFVWGWLLTAPWTLNFSTHVVNPSYVLPGGILFFVGALETYPATRRGLVPTACPRASSRWRASSWRASRGATRRSASRSCARIYGSRPSPSSSARSASFNRQR